MEDAGSPVDSTDADDSTSVDEDQGQGNFAFYALSGDRFDGPGMPADSAPEITYFRQAIFEIARQIFLERNPDRKNLPHGFDSAFDLRLLAVHPGSSQLQTVIHRKKSIDAQTWDEWSGIFGDALDTFEGIGQSAALHEVPTGLPPRVARAVRRVGSTLGASETVTVGHPTIASRRATLDIGARTTLERINEVLEQEPAGPSASSVTGIITEYDGTGRSFHVKTDDGLAPCVLEAENRELAELVRSLLALDGVTAPDVAVEGETIEPDRRPLRLFNVHRITILREWGEKVLAQRLGLLTSLEAGWFGPDSQAPEAAALRALELSLARLAGLGVPVELMPSIDGSVVIETRRGDVELSVSLEGDGSMVLIRDDVITDELVEDQVDFDVEALIAFLQRGALA